MHDTVFVGGWVSKGLQCWLFPGMAAVIAAFAGTRHKDKALKRRGVQLLMCVGLFMRCLVICFTAPLLHTCSKAQKPICALRIVHCAAYCCIFPVRVVQAEWQARVSGVVLLLLGAHLPLPQLHTYGRRESAAERPGVRPMPLLRCSGRPAATATSRSTSTRSSCCSRASSSC